MTDTASQPRKRIPLTEGNLKEIKQLCERVETAVAHLGDAFSAVRIYDEPNDGEVILECISAVEYNLERMVGMLDDITPPDAELRTEAAQ